MKRCSAKRNKWRVRADKIRRHRRRRGVRGTPCAIEAALNGAEALPIDKGDDIGGALHLTGGHLSAAGARRQAERGIADEFASTTVDWLEDDWLELAAGTPSLVYGHEPHDVPRTYYASETGRSILDV